MFKKIISLALVSVVFFSCTSNVDEVEVKKARQFFESVFQDQVLDSPEFQASLGYKSNYDQWDDITWQKSRERAKRAADDLKFMKKNINFDKIDEDTKISYKLMEKRLQRTIDSDNFIFHVCRHICTQVIERRNFLLTRRISLPVGYICKQVTLRFLPLSLQRFKLAASSNLRSSLSNASTVV